jgi:hypothetical protein
MRIAVFCYMTPCSQVDVYTAIIGYDDHEEKLESNVGQLLKK